MPAKSLYLDATRCKGCGACAALCPEVFYMDRELEIAAIRSDEPYPEDQIDTAIAACPGRCIEWVPNQGAEVRDYFCQKYQEKMAPGQPACRHPQDYCQFRNSCVTTQVV